MKIGVFLFPEARNPSQDGQIINETIQEAHLAEQLGTDAVFLAEHHFDGNCVYVDPPTFAASLAASTSRIKIGFAVLQTSLYHPIRLAEQLSLLDHLSKGRLIVGLGRGSLVNTHEYSGYEIEPDSAQERFEEIEKILLQCWTNEKVVHAGKYWNFEIPMLRPRPLSSPHPMLLRSTASDDSLIAQAKKGRPVIMASPTASRAAKALDLYRKSMSEAGFDEQAVEHAVSQCWAARTVVLAPTDKEANEVGMPYFKQMQEYRAAQSSKFQAKVAKANAQMAPQILCGSPDSMMEEFTALQKTGIGGVIVRFRTGPMPAAFANRGMQLFMKEIAPAIH